MWEPDIKKKQKSEPISAKWHTLWHSGSVETSWVCHTLPEITLHHLLLKPFTFSTPLHSTVTLNRFPSFKVLHFRLCQWWERSFREPHTDAVREAVRLPPQRSWRWSPNRGGGIRSLSDPAGDLQEINMDYCNHPQQKLLTLVSVCVSFIVDMTYLRWWTMSQDKMCTKRMARPMFSRMTMQTMMVFGPWWRHKVIRFSAIDYLLLTLKMKYKTFPKYVRLIFIMTKNIIFL